MVPRSTRFRELTKRRPTKAVVAAIDLVAAYLIWQMASAIGALPGRYFPSANVVLRRLVEMLEGPDLWNILGPTLQSWALGLALSIVTAIPLGIALGTSSRALQFFLVPIEALRPIPPVALIPIALLVFGPVLQMKLLLILQATFWILLLQAVYGVRSVDPITLQTARSMRLGIWREFALVRIPGALPLIVTGVRIAATFSLIAAVVAELVGGAPGIGNEILKAESNGDQATMYTLILVTGFLGIAVNVIFRRLERRLLFWHPTQRGAVR